MTKESKESRTKESPALTSLGWRCSTAIRSDIDQFKRAAEWFMAFEVPRATMELRTDEYNPDRHTLIATLEGVSNPDETTAEDRDRRRLYVVDHEEKVAEYQRPLFRRLVAAYTQLFKPYVGKDLGGDIGASLGREEAERIVLLSALVFCPDFSGDEFGINWPWEDEANEHRTLESRADVWMAITIRMSVQSDLRRLIETALSIVIAIQGRDVEVVPSSDGSNSSGFVLLEDHRLIAMTLAASEVPLPLVVIGQRVHRSPNTVRKRIVELKAEGFVIQPKGPRQGYVLTDCGHSSLLLASTDRLEQES